MDLTGAQAAFPDDDAALAGILELLRVRAGTDFSRYRPDMIRRRVQNRMMSAGVRTLRAYLEMLERQADETPQLIDRVTIKVSRFYRNAVTFDRLASDVMPRLAASRRPVRIWSAGCACGEEAWTLAMLMIEAGLDGSVLATDIDRRALARADAGVHGEAALAELPAPLRDRHLRSRGQEWEVRDALRERVRFVHHDLTAPTLPEPGAFDLVSCRNVLIYLRKDLQQQVLRRLTASLRPGGYLLLGEAEWPSVGLAGLRVVSRSARIFEREHSGATVEEAAPAAGNGRG